MKAVLDSSVLVSAFFSPNSTSAHLLEHASEGAFTLCLSQEILEETRGVLMRDRHRVRLRYAPEQATSLLRSAPKGRGMRRGATA
ncbi:MAG: PIN domain-containing protein [Geminicoccaceae bacterium]